MTDFDIFFKNKLDGPPKVVEVFKQNHGGWDHEGTVPEMESEHFTISSDNDSITIKVAPKDGRKDHQVCDVEFCGPCHECGPPSETDDREGWTIEITNSCQEAKADTGGETTTVEIRDNQP